MLDNGRIFRRQIGDRMTDDLLGPSRQPQVAEVHQFNRGGLKRVRRLKERNYIAGRGNSLVPGTALTIWRDRQKDEPEEE